MGPELYLDHIAQAKNNVSIPIIASLNAAEQATGSATLDGRASRASLGQRPRCRARRTAGALKARFIQRRLSTMDHRVVIAGGIPGLVCERSLLLWAARFCRASEFDALLVCLEHSPRQRRPAANLTTSLRKLMSGELRL